MRGRHCCKVVSWRGFGISWVEGRLRWLTVVSFCAVICTEPGRVSAGLGPSPQAHSSVAPPPLLPGDVLLPCPWPVVGRICALHAFSSVPTLCREVMWVLWACLCPCLVWGGWGFSKGWGQGWLRVGGCWLCLCPWCCIGFTCLTYFNSQH